MRIGDGQAYLRKPARKYCRGKGLMLHAVKARNPRECAHPEVKPLLLF